MVPDGDIPTKQTPLRPLVVGIGEVLWDRFPGGRTIGGAPANFAYHAGALGASAWVVSAVGNDPDGQTLLAGLEDRGLNTTAIARDSDHATGSVTVRLDESGIPTYDIMRDVAWDHLRWRDDLEQLAGRCDIVCFGTLAQRSPETRETIRRFVGSTPADCLRLFDINLRQGYFDEEVIHTSLDVCSILKLNEEELHVVARMFGITGPPQDIMNHLADRFDIEAVALTRGSRGCLVISRGVVVDHPGVRPAEIVDTVGAGDCFAATLAVSTWNGDSMDAVVDRSARRAAYVCSMEGAMPDMDRF